MSVTLSLRYLLVMKLQRYKISILRHHHNLKVQNILQNHLITSVTSVLLNVCEYCYSCWTRTTLGF